MSLENILAVFGEIANKKKREAVKKKICHQNEDGPK